MSALAVETAGLVKRFGAVTAVDGVDLAVPERAVYGFLGPNGAGKTTTIRLLLGLLRPTAGTARIFGSDVRTERRGALRGVGAVIEAPSLYDHLPGRENLEITRRVLNLPRGETDRVLALTGLEGAQRRRAGTYSMGMRQRLALARAMLGAPRLLLLDEPTNGLDPDGIQEMRGFIRELPERTGATVLLSSHLLSEVEQTATHVGLISKGRLAVQAPLGALLAGSGAAIEFDVDAPERAAALIAGARPGDAVEITATGLSVRPEGGDTRGAAAAMNAALVGGGIAVFRIAPKTLSLEDIYMRHAHAGAREDSDVSAPD